MFFCLHQISFKALCLCMCDSDRFASDQNDPFSLSFSFLLPVLQLTLSQLWSLTQQGSSWPPGIREVEWLSSRGSRRYEMPTVYHQFTSLTESKNVSLGLSASNCIFFGIKLKICLIRFLKMLFLLSVQGTRVLDYT